MQCVGGHYLANKSSLSSPFPRVWHHCKEETSARWWSLRARLSPWRPVQIFRSGSPSAQHASIWPVGSHFMQIMGLYQGLIDMIQYFVNLLKINKSKSIICNNISFDFFKTIFFSKVIKNLHYIICSCMVWTINFQFGAKGNNSIAVRNSKGSVLLKPSNLCHWNFNTRGRFTVKLPGKH